jgi:hypothetical protein
MHRSTAADMVVRSKSRPKNSALSLLVIGPSIGASRFHH